MKKEGLKPLINHNTEVLILGTMPSDISIKSGEYYANNSNQFWKIIFSVFNYGKFESDYQKKSSLLLKNKIGLWDVLLTAEREGSMDSNIFKPKFNDFDMLFKNYSHIKRLVFNGKNAAEYFNGLDIDHKDKNLYTMPSTSSANTWKTFFQKCDEWREILVR